MKFKFLYLTMFVVLNLKSAEVTDLVENDGFDEQSASTEDECINGCSKTYFDLLKKHIDDTKKHRPLSDRYMNCLIRCKKKFNPSNQENLQQSDR